MELRNFIISISLSLLFFSCKEKEKPEPAIPTGSIQLEIDHIWENPDASTSPFKLEQNFVQANTGDTLQFYTMKYYISNIRLKKTDGSWYKIPESYHLIDVKNNSLSSIQLSNIPIQEYSAIEIMYGIDSTRNVSGAQTGALAISNGMFWTWNTGYIFIKAEGTSPQASATQNTFTFHLAGFSGVNKISMTNQYEFNGEKINVTQTKTPKIRFKSPINTLWKNAQSVAFESNLQATGSIAKSMSKEFYSSFSFDYIIN
jgi:hypothetical protein